MMRFACRSPRRWSCTRSHRARGLREDIELVLVARVMQGRITDRIPELECQRAGADARDLGGYTYVGVAAAKHLVVPQQPDGGQVEFQADVQIGRASCGERVCK